MVPEQKVVDIVYRLWLLTQERGFSISLISYEAGISKSTIRSWFNSVTPPVMRWRSYDKAMTFLVRVGG